MDGNHLGDAVVFFDDGAGVHGGEEDEDLAAVSGIDDAAVGEDAFSRDRHGRAVANEEAESAAIDGDAGADFVDGAGVRGWSASA